MKRVNPDVVAAPIGAYSHLTFVPRDRQLVFLAGQVGTAADGSIAPDVETQTEQTLRNIEALLASIDCTPRDLVRLLTFVNGEAALPGFYETRNRIYREWFGDELVPGHSLAVVAALAKPGILVEIEGWIAAPIESEPA